MKKLINKSMVLTGAVVALLSTATPGHAGTFGVFGSYWDTKDADHGFGGGVKGSFDLGEVLQLDLRGTYFNDLIKRADAGDLKLHASPLDVGLSFAFNPGGAVRPYVGGGGSYYLLDSNHGTVSDEVGYYAMGGVEFGSLSTGPHFFAEAIYRDVTGTVKRRAADETFPDVSGKVKLQLRGVGANAGCSGASRRTRDAGEKKGERSTASSPKEVERAMHEMNTASSGPAARARGHRSSKPSRSASRRPRAGGKVPKQKTTRS